MKITNENYKTLDPQSKEIIKRVVRNFMDTRFTYYDNSVLLKNDFTVMNEDQDIETLWGYSWVITDWPGVGNVSNMTEIAMNHGITVLDFEELGMTALTINGGGYDFYDQHFIPMYLDLDLEWHTLESDWNHFEEILQENHLKIYIGPCWHDQYLKMFKEVFGPGSVYAGTEHIFVRYHSEEFLQEQMDMLGHMKDFICHATKIIKKD